MANRPPYTPPMSSRRLGTLRRIVASLLLAVHLGGCSVTQARPVPVPLPPDSVLQIRWDGRDVALRTPTLEGDSVLAGQAYWRTRQRDFLSVTIGLGRWAADSAQVRIPITEAQLLVRQKSVDRTIRAVALGSLFVVISYALTYGLAIPR